MIPESKSQNDIKESQAGCEILEMLQIRNSKGIVSILKLILNNVFYGILILGLFEPQYVIVGTTIGLAMVDINIREMVSCLPFEQLNHQENSGTLNSMVSSLKLSLNCQNELNVLIQYLADKRTAIFQILLENCQNTSHISIVAQNQPKGFFDQIQKVIEFSKIFIKTLCFFKCKNSKKIEKSKKKFKNSKNSLFIQTSILISEL
jgi:hypothetical protein